MGRVIAASASCSCFKDALRPMRCEGGDAVVDSLCCTAVARDVAACVCDFGASDVGPLFGWLLVDAASDVGPWPELSSHWKQAT